MLAARPARRSGPGTSRDAGLGLVEVIVAMLIFGVIATGIIGAVTITLRMTPDNEHREVAANLAAQEIDLVRAIADPYQVSARTTTQTINGVVYTIDRETGWLQPNGIAGTCGASNANFELKVNVDVSWTGQAATTPDIRSDSVLAPQSTLTTNSTGAMAIYVYDSTSSPQSGVSITLAAAGNGAITPTVQPGATGSDGCSYIGRLTPGNYTVTAKRTGAGGTQTATKTNQAVAAGSTSTVPLTLNGSGTLVPQLAPDQDPTVLRPTDLTVSYLTANGIVYTSTAPSVVAQSTVPGTLSYAAVAGKVGNAGTAPEICPELDPAAWGAGTSNGIPLANGTRDSAVPLRNLQTRNIAVPMGAVTLNLAAGEFVKAVQSTPDGAGNPGCASPTMTIHFPVTTDTQAVLALPYGTWKLYEGPLQPLITLPVQPVQIAGTSNSAGGGIAPDGTVTIDPRPLR